jgi:hypothetical protein
MGYIFLSRWIFWSWSNKIKGRSHEHALQCGFCWNGKGKHILTYGFILNIENKIIYYSNKFVFMYLYDLQ